MTAPVFSISNKISPSTSPASFRRSVLAGKRLIGVNVTDGACAPDDPVAAAKLLASYGINWVRLHHVDFGILAGWWTVEKVVAFQDALYAVGIRTSLDGFSKLGEKYPGGNDQFKRDLMTDMYTARRLYEQNLERITPLLQHKGCFMFCLANECAWACETADIAKEFWEWASPKARAINPLLIVTDLPDAYVHGPKFVPVVALHDLGCLHTYLGTEDFASAAKPNWTSEFWNWNAVRWFRDMVRDLRPDMKFLIQEFGSWSVNPHYAQNLVFLQTMAAVEGMSTCFYCFASNSYEKTEDKYAAVRDPMLLNMILFGAYLSKNMTGLRIPYWAGYQNKGESRFEALGEKAAIHQDRAVINSYIWTWRADAPWVWLVKSF